MSTKTANRHSSKTLSFMARFSRRSHFYIRMTNGFLKISIALSNLGVIPLSAHTFLCKRPRIPHSPVCFSCCCCCSPSLTAVFTGSGSQGHHKFPQFSVQPPIPTKAKVHLFNGVIFCSGYHSCSLLNSQLLKLVQFSMQVHKVHSHGSVSKLSC